jgi:hypothetical protein
MARTTQESPTQGGSDSASTAADQNGKDRALAQKVAERVLQMWREELRREQERRGRLGKGF